MTMPEWREADRDDPLALAYFGFPGIGTPPPARVLGSDERLAKVVGVVAPHAWRWAGDTLGTEYCFEAFQLAELLGHRKGDLLRRGDPIAWAKAIVWVVAGRNRMIDPYIDGGMGEKTLSRDLDSTAAKLKKDAARILNALDRNGE